MPAISKVYVYVPEGDIDHVSACVIQGLCDMGIQVACNVDVRKAVSRGISQPYSQLAPTELFSIAPYKGDEDLLILSVPFRMADWFAAVKEIAKRKPVAFINMHDNANYVDYDESVFAFAAHVNRFAPRFGRIAPIGFTLSNDIIRLASSVDLDGPRRGIVHNFNKTFNQEVRLSLELVLVEKMERFFEIVRRHLPPEEYAQQLAGALAVLAYGGSYSTNYIDYEYMRNSFMAAPAQLSMRTFKNFTRESVVFRWDSWRFWEAALFGAAPLQLDFDKYGFELPVNPRPWIEYIPVDLAEAANLPGQLAERLRHEPDLFTRIGANSRQWALDNYSPTAVANYVLRTCGLAP